MRQQTEILKDNTNSAAQGRQRTARRGGHIRTQKTESAAGWANGQIKQAQQAGLSRTGRAEQPAERPCVETKTDVVQDFGGYRRVRADAASLIAQPDGFES